MQETLVIVDVASQPTGKEEIDAFCLPLGSVSLNYSFKFCICSEGPDKLLYSIIIIVLVCYIDV